MIHLENVQKVYQTERVETLALANINIKVDSGEFVSIMGPSGCGKTTMLNIMGLLDEPSQGTVHLDGTPINGGSEKHKARIRNRTAGFIFLGTSSGSKWVPLPASRSASASSGDIGV